MLKESNEIYLDHVSTSSINEEVLKTYKKLLDDYYNSDALYDGGVIVYRRQEESRERIADLLNVKKEECIVFEDSLVGVEAAKSAGIDTLVMYDKYSDENRDKINKFSKLRFNNFTELLDEIKKEV